MNATQPLPFVFKATFDASTGLGAIAEAVERTEVRLELPPDKPEWAAERAATRVAASIGEAAYQAGLEDFAAAQLKDRRARQLAKATLHGPHGQAFDGNTGEVTMSELLSEVLVPAKWLVDGLVPAGPAVGGLLGQYKSGKSLAGLQLCFAVAVGADSFLGHEIEQGGPTVFVEYEGSRVRLRDRVNIMAAKHGAYTPPAPLSIVHRPPYKVDTEEGEEWLHKLCQGKVLCVIGPVSKAATILKENEPGEWQAVSERLQRVTDETGCSIILIHHTRKPNVQFGAPRKVDDYFNAARGSNSYMGAVDFALGVQREQEDVEGIFFYLERDGESGRLAYSFDIPSLCIWPDDRPLTKAKSEDKVEQMYLLIQDNPDVNRARLVELMGVSQDTVKAYLERLGERVVEAGIGNATRTYKVTGGLKG